MATQYRINYGPWKNLEFDTVLEIRSDADVSFREKPIFPEWWDSPVGTTVKVSSTLYHHVSRWSAIFSSKRIPEEGDFWITLEEDGIPYPVPTQDILELTDKLYTLIHVPAKKERGCI